MGPQTRRELLRHLGLATVPVLTFVACGDDNSATDGDATDAAALDAASDGSAIDGSSTNDGAITGDWARGGTAAMTDKANYPDPFTGMPASCVLVASTTLGPCTTVSDLAREDVSEGQAGLPVRLGIRVVDASCTPIVGAVVKIWHTRTDGIYTGVTPAPAACSSNNQAAIATDVGRGVQTTDTRGIVYFDTLFPGWYRGRAVHIHFQVKRDGTSTRVSQLFFPEPITTSVFDRHPDYDIYGQPDTTFANDGVMAGIPTAGRDRLTCEVARMTDGVMLASKTVTVVS